MGSPNGDAIFKGGKSMTELVYTFEPSHLWTYQKLASDRASGAGRAGSWDVEGLRFIVAAMATAAVLALADLVMPLITDRPFAYLEFLAGLLLGIGMMIGAMWWHYRKMRRRAVRPDGPTLSEHRMSVTPEGLRTTSPLYENVYRWSALDEVTVHDDVIVLWVEPAAGALVPRSAFADRSAERQFVEGVRARIAEAKLPRAGSFA
jgi:hypothetical protein